MRDKWDKKLKKEIFNILKYHGKAERDFLLLFQKDRKHQLEETLKQLPDVKDEQRYSINYVDGWNDCLCGIKDKLKEKNDHT